MPAWVILWNDGVSTNVILWTVNRMPAPLYMGQRQEPEPYLANKYHRASKSCKCWANESQSWNKSEPIRSKSYDAPKCQSQFMIKATGPPYEFLVEAVGV